MTITERYCAACANTNRKFIGIEMVDNYFQIGKERILGTATNIQPPDNIQEDDF